MQSCLSSVSFIYYLYLQNQNCKNSCVYCALVIFFIYLLLLVVFFFFAGQHAIFSMQLIVNFSIERKSQNRTTHKIGPFTKITYTAIVIINFKYFIFHHEIRVSGGASISSKDVSDTNKKCEISRRPYTMADLSSGQCDAYIRCEGVSGEMSFELCEDGLVYGGKYFFVVLYNLFLNQL